MSPKCTNAWAYSPINTWVALFMFVPFLVFSKMQSAIIGCLPCSWLPLVFEPSPADTEARKKRISAQNCVSALNFPLRAVVFFAVTLLMYPMLLITALFRAIYVRMCRGGPWETLGQPTQEGVGPSYFCQLMFTKDFDQAKLSAVFYEMVKEAGFPEDLALIEFPPIPTKDSAPPNKPYESNHVVETEAHWIAYGQKTYGNHVIALRVFNGAGKGPAVFHAYMPSTAWDGTSNYNFLKELVSRYYGKPKNDVFGSSQKLEMSPTSKAALQGNTSFGSFLCRLPWAVWTNTTALLWSLLGANPFFGGAGLSFEIAMFNFDEDFSSRLAAALKAKGIKPFVGVSWAGSMAMKAVLGKGPANVCAQVSAQAKHFTPQVARDQVGDWLLGPSYPMDEKNVTFAEHTAMYNTILKELDKLSGASAEAIEAKHYSLVNGGAAVYEAWPFYPLDAAVFGNCLFFNNYGLREMVPEAGCVSFNWAAPFYIGLNTISVNGRTCFSVASSVLGLDKVRAVRDETCRILTEIVEKGVPADALPASTGKKEMV